MMLSGTLVFPAVAGGIVTAPVFVPLIFGEAWKPGHSKYFSFSL